MPDKAVIWMRSVKQREFAICRQLEHKLIAEAEFVKADDHPAVRHPTGGGMETKSDEPCNSLGNSLDVKLQT